jgi:general secretion pathway protein G
MRKNKNNKGFTLIELLVVIAIIGILSTLAVVALGNARIKARDAKRVSDMRQIMSALELYYNDAGGYPTAISPGSKLNSPDGTTTYMAIIPSNPSPNNDGPCPTSTNYAYATDGNIPPSTYTISYCLGSNIGDLTSGTHNANPGGFTN